MILSTLWLPRAVWTAHVTNGAASGTLELGGGGGQNYAVLDYDQTTQEYASTSFVWTGCNQVTAEIVWTASAATGPVVWQVYCSAYTDSDDLIAIGGSAGSVTSSIASSDTMIRASANVPLPTGAIDGRFATVTLTRTPGNAADTLAADARFIGMLLTFK